MQYARDCELTDNGKTRQNLQRRCLLEGIHPFVVYNFLGGRLTLGWKGTKDIFKNGSLIKNDFCFIHSDDELDHARKEEMLIMSGQKESSMVTVDLVEKTERAEIVSMRYRNNHRAEYKSMGTEKQLAITRKFYQAENPEELKNLSPKEIMAMQ